MLYFTFSKGSLKEMIYSERDFYSVSKPIFSYYCLRKKKKRERKWGWMGEGRWFSCATRPVASLNAAMQ